MPKQERFRFQADISLPSTRQRWGIFDVRAGGGYVLTEHPYGKAGSGDTSLPGTYGTLACGLIRLETDVVGIQWRAATAINGGGCALGACASSSLTLGPQSMFISLLGHTWCLLTSISTTNHQ